MEEHCFEPLLGLNLNPEPKRNSYIRPIDKDAGKIAGSLDHSSKYLTPLPLYSDRSILKLSIVSKSGLIPPNPHLTVFMEFKSAYPGDE